MVAELASEFRNESGLGFTDISSEEYREYRFADGDRIRIQSPLQLHVSSHGHRVFSADGISHYIPLTWIHLHWKAKEGMPHFVK
jgi:hypothetical protein